MNFGSLNLTKQKKKNLETQQNVTQKRILGIQQNVTTFSQYFLFPTMVGLSLIFYYFIFYIHSIFTTNFRWKIIIGFKITH